MTKRRNGTLLKPLFRPRRGNICCTAGDARQVDVDPGYHAGFVFQRLLQWRAYSPGVHQGWRVLLLPSHSSRLGDLLRAALSGVTGEHTLAERVEKMLIADGKQTLLDGASLKLIYVEDMYYSARHDGNHFILDFVKVGKFSHRFAEEAEWDDFCRKVPAIVRDDPEWVSGPAQETPQYPDDQEDV